MSSCRQPTRGARGPWGWAGATKTSESYKMLAVYGTPIWRTLVSTVMNTRFSRRWWTSTNSATISVSLRTPLNRVTFRSTHAGCMIDSHNIHCHLLLPCRIICSMLNSFFSIILRITNRCHFFVIFLYYMSLPYIFRASISPSSGVFPAVATCCHLEPSGNK